VTSMKGMTTAIEIGDEFKEIGQSPLGETVVASFAFGPGRIYLRGETHLFAIGAR
jgi:outer membrane protein assembly factor BamB